MSEPSSISYRIRGDDREYGPFNLANLQNWIRFGRVDANTEIWDSQTRSWRIAPSIPELAPSFGGTPAATPTHRRWKHEEVTSIHADYDVDLGNWLSGAWELHWTHLRFVQGAYWRAEGPLLIINTVMRLAPLLFVLVGLAVAQHTKTLSSPVLPQIVLTSALVATPLGIVLTLLASAFLRANLWLVMLNCLRGRRAWSGQVWSRLRLSYKPIFKVYITVHVIAAACGLPAWLLLRFAPKAGALTVWLKIAGGVLLIPCVCAGLLLMFALPLMAERNQPIRNALASSYRAVKQHWFALLWFLMLSSLPSVIALSPSLFVMVMGKAWHQQHLLATCVCLAVSGLLALLTGAFGQCAITVAYDRIFGVRPMPANGIGAATR